MSREPSSPMHRSWKHYEKVSPPPEPTQPKAGPPKRVPRVRVENPGKERRERVMTKFTTTTEKLTADELALLAEMREVDPTAASRSLAALRKAKKETR